MNSLILTSLVSFFRWLWGAFLSSGTYSLFMKIYNAVSGSWNRSVLLGALRRVGKDEVGNTVSGRICFSPFALADLLKNRFGEFIKNDIRSSVLCSWSRTYLHNFMAVNTRFFGLMLFGMGAGYCVGGMRFSKIAAAVGVIGALLCVFNFNLMSFLNSSKTADIVKSAAGFKNLDFEFYSEPLTHERIRLELGLILGLLTGIAAEINIFGAVLPFALFGLLLVLYAPVTGVFAAVFLAPFVPTMALAGLCLWTGLSLLIKSVTYKSFKWRFDGVGQCIILMLAILLVSSLASFVRTESLKVWAMYLVFLGFYFIIINTVKTREQLYGLVKLLVISGALVALYGVLQYVFGWTTSNAWIDEEMFEDSTMRVYSTLGNPNVLGEYLLLVLPFAAVYMIRDRWRSLSKYAYGAMFLVLGLCLVLTQSRGCWIGFVISVCIFVTFYNGKWWGLIPAVLCVLPFIMPQTVVDRLMSIGDLEDSSTSYRVYIWMGTLGMMKHYWLGGIGMGEAEFSQVYPFFSYNAIVAPHSHNTFLQLLVEAGAAGLGIFLAMQIVFAKKMSDTYRLAGKRSRTSMLSLAAASGVIGFLVQSMFDYTFYNYRVMAVFFMVMALGMALKHISENDGGIPDEN